MAGMIINRCSGIIGLYDAPSKLYVCQTGSSHLPDAESKPCSGQVVTRITAWLYLIGMYGLCGNEIICDIITQLTIVIKSLKCKMATFVRAFDWIPQFTR